MQAAAAAKVNQLHDELITLPFDQEERILAIGWQLRLLHRQAPNDMPVAVTLMNAIAMAGAAEEARTMASRLWTLRQTMSPVVKPDYLDCLIRLAMYEQAAAMLAAVANHFLPADIAPLQRDIAVGLGDAAFFAQLGDHVEPELAPLCQRLAQHSDYFRARQAAVRSVVAGHQVAYTTYLVSPDAETDGELDVGIFVAGDVAARRMLEQRIDDAVAKVSAEFGIEGDALPIIENVHNHRAHGGLKPI